MQNNSHKKQPHIPVMLKEVLQYLLPKNGGVYVDATFGAGGYSKAILESADCQVIAIDKDPNVAPYFESLNKAFPGRIKLVQGSFADIQALLLANNVKCVDGIVFDLGISSMQVDEGERGFSFMHDGPLDMRMSGQGISAADIVNNESEKNLADQIYKLGGERQSRHIARAICMARQKEKIVSTVQLANIIRKSLRYYGDSIDPSTRTFQALRIWVNDELEDIKKALVSSEKVLLEGGRLVVVSFHSLEDEIVKQFMLEKSGKAESVSRHMPFIPSSNKVSEKRFDLLLRHALKPTDDEVNYNIRARSAKLRAAVHTNKGACII